ncbi:NAD-dependent epimerase/dehydratase family protein [Nocardia gipuzkoensis]|uniref:NAD-dependent epimerase/dehydratase family protein n=1 Tax=Nocardia gipuzkoensis TaxID=2749991 RepID=UPI00237E5898|nr:NAD(P)-dependent oxidoreductase [Nocardia gipuzkoensis]MDE1674756.1 NAD(P)-dependent oxidoreductase [Nocardia gipuzkoensis]
MANVIITGALGTLGRAATEHLTACGHRITTLDFRAASGAIAASHVADIRDPDTYRHLLADAEVVVHLASLHGRDHMTRFGFDDFWSVNVDGTLALYRSIIDTAVTHVVLASSMAVYGPIPVAPRTDWEVRTESTSTTSYDAYSLTKLTNEATADYTAADTGIPTTVLRFGHFTPADPLHYAFRLLFGGVDTRDAAHAIAAAIAHPPEKGSVAKLNIHAPSPLIERIDSLSGPALDQVRDLYPVFIDRLHDAGIDPVVHLWGRSTWPSTAATTAIGYSPTYTFGRFAHAYLTGDMSDYGNLLGPRWGVTDKSLTTSVIR